MIFSELQTQVSDKIGYGDQVSKIPTYINSAIHQLEQEVDWPHMENTTSGNLTSSVDYVSIPTRYKNTKLFIITNDTFQKSLRRTDYTQLLMAYPYGNASKNTPVMFARKQSEGKFIVRPYPDKTYPYELVTNVYSADLSAGSDTNYWTTNNWEIVMYGALLQFKLDSGVDINVGTPENPIKPEGLYNDLLQKLTRNLTNEKTSNGISYSTATWVY